MAWSANGNRLGKRRAFLPFPPSSLPTLSLFLDSPFVFFIETGSHYVDQGGLDLTVHPSLSLNL